MLQVKLISHGTSVVIKFRYHAIVVVGDYKARVCLSIPKANTVRDAIEKSMSHAKRHMMSFSFGNALTAPFEINGNSHSTMVITKPAKEGHSIISGGVVRSVLEALGIRNICCKVHGSSHRNRVFHATIDALQKIEQYKGAFHARKDV